MLAALRVALRVGPISAPQFRQDAQQRSLWVVNANVKAGFPVQDFLEEAKKFGVVVQHMFIKHANVAVLEYAR